MFEAICKTFTMLMLLSLPGAAPGPHIIGQIPPGPPPRIPLPPGPGMIPPQGQGKWTRDVIVSGLALWL